MKNKTRDLLKAHIHLKNTSIEVKNKYPKTLVFIAQEDDTEGEFSSDSGVLEKVQVTEPSFYKVLLHNDDYTPMEFVTQILKKFFHKSPQEAESIMMAVHKKGHGVAGVFPYEIAETKVFMTNNYAKQNKFPLKCSMEEE